MSTFDSNFPECNGLETVPEIVPAETSPVSVADVSRGVPAHSAAELEGGTSALVETFEVLSDDEAFSAKALPEAETVVEGVLADDESDANGEDVDEPADDVEFGVSALTTRIERWKSRLLDLSLKNRLLNFDFRKALKIYDAGLDALEDAFAPGVDGEVRRFKIFSPPEIKGFSAADAAGESERKAFVARALEAGKIVVEAPPKTGKNAGKTAAERTAARLAAIQKNARKSLEETGTSTLFIALGFLRWKSGKDKKNRTLAAPILLVPATLSCRSGLRAEIRASDEGVRINLTLVELLRQEYGLCCEKLNNLCEELPSDGAGVATREIFDIFRDVVKRRADFEVEESCAIANLSFSKYQMWFDLEKRADVLRRSCVVDHLLAETPTPFETKIPFPDVCTLDEKVAAAEIFCPLPLDSSQLAAVRAAALGKNFILVGPPGTGKSQTIANLIANVLAEGKTVLFVAEKAAALNVVFKRLKTIGLGEFCLELHSEKASRKDAYASFREAFELAEKGVSRGANDAEKRRLAVAAEIDGLRVAFSRISKALYEKRKNGLSFAEALGVVCCREEDPEIELVWKNPADATEGNRRKKADIADRLGKTFSAAGEALAGAAGSIAVRAWSMEFQRAAETAANALANAARELNSRAEAFVAVTNLADFAGEAPLSLKRLRVLRGLVAALLAVRDEADAGTLVFGADGAKNLAALREAAKLVNGCATHRGQLSLPYAETATDAPELDALLRLWDESKISWAFPRWLKQRKVVRALRALAGGSEKTPEDPRVDLGNLVALRDKKREFAEKFSALADAFPALLKKDLSDCGALSRLDTLDVARAAVEAAAEQVAPDARSAFRTAIEEAFRGNDLDIYAPAGAAEKALADLSAAESAFVSARAALEELFAAPLPEAAFASAEKARAFAEEAFAAREFWESVCEWNAAVKRASDNGMAAFADALRDGRVSEDTVVRVFETNYCRRWAEAVFDSEAALKEASATNQRTLLEKFRAADETLRRISADVVRMRLIARARGIFDPKCAKELREARKEIESKRHKSLRQFFAATPRLRFLLKPCMLASPLSVATYLDAEAKPFDLVVFDEASQICAWDAVGALARGGSAVVVGDPKQLPPTSFFSRANKAIDAGETVPDAESVLDECRICGVPAMQLAWHYRSRAESLIAFSNSRYYGGELATFPEPRTRNRALECVFVEKGVYAKSTNPAEACALVERIVADLSRPGFVYDEFSSVGVVTFNEKQQTLIEKLLEAAQEAHPEIRKYFSAAEVAEPVFVKNLENVQGDERGVIYFSTTYGPAKERCSGASADVAQNFGPVNQGGGERRLNVAITRARAGMCVFTSMHPGEITSKSAGAADLREFLRFASEGILAGAKTKSAFEADGKGFAKMRSRECAEDAIADDLRKRGWNCVRDVGVSGVRVDIAVVDPANPDAFLAGILCDGAGRQRDLAVRDREILREDVLRGLGWNLLRVRSLDRWRTPKRCLDKLEEQLGKLCREATLPVPAAK